MHNVVFAAAAETAAAKRQPVMGIRVQIKQAVKVFFTGDDARDAKDRPRRIVRVDRHVDITVDGNRDDLL